jgi:hypothetical protein
MLRKFVALTLLVSSLGALAQADERAKLLAKENFCNKRAEADSIQEMLVSPMATLSFSNQGGLFGGGVCWWHSRFTRNAAYIVRFRPDLPAPTDAEAKKLIKDIRSAKAIVEVPGYANLYNFSRAHDELILKELEAWQRKDGFVNQQWVAGLSGSSNIKPEALERRMDELFARVQKGEVVYQKLQMPGVTAHAWLVLGMTQTADGYRLLVLDSNTYAPDTYYYEKGMTSFDYHGFTHFVPYTGKTSEEAKLKRIVAKDCGFEAPETDGDEETEDETQAP